MKKGRKESVINKIFRVLIFFFIIGFALIGLKDAILLMGGEQNAYAAKPDPCKLYQKKAHAFLSEMQKAASMIGYYQRELSAASRSAAYSSYYLVCRDLEQRESK